MTETEILDEMIGRLQDKGWIKGIIWEEITFPVDVILMDGSKPIRGRACLQGTAELCGDRFSYGHGVIAQRLSAVIAELFPGRTGDRNYWGAIVEFNDHEDTTFEDVMLVLKHAREALT